MSQLEVRDGRLTIHVAPVGHPQTSTGIDLSFAPVDPAPPAANNLAPTQPMS